MFFSTFSLTEAMNFQSSVSRHPFGHFSVSKSELPYFLCNKIRLVIKRLILAFNMLMLKGFAM